jgi:hypothetical protein
MVLVPGPPILNGAIDLARTRITLGISRMAYAGAILPILPRMLFERVLAAPA